MGGKRLLAKESESKVDDFYDRSFRWTISKLNPTRLELKLEFNNPGHISADSTNLDRMIIKFKNVDKLLIGEDDDAFKGPENLAGMIS